MAAARIPVNRGRSRTEAQSDAQGSDERVEMLPGSVPVSEMLRNQPDVGPTDALAKVQASKERDGMVTRSAVDPTKIERPPTQQFVVIADRHVQGAAGQRTLMRAGKVLDTVQYDVAKLKAQGLQVRPFDPAADGLMA